MEVDPNKVKNDGICEACQKPCPCHANEYAAQCECACNMAECTCQRCGDNRGHTLVEDLVNP